MYQNPQPTLASLLAAYGQVKDTRYEDEREGRVHTFRRALDELEVHAGRGRLLDVGAHIGVFLEVAAERSWMAEGVEPSRWAAARARSRGLHVEADTVADLGPTAGPYDVITLWDVIEHLPDPAAELTRLHGLLVRGGVIALSTMDVEAPMARLMGRHWPWLMQMHLFYFSRRTLARLVQNAGYELIEMRRHRRIVRLAYLISRLEGCLPRLSRALPRVLDGLGLGARLISVDVGDIVTLFARKPGDCRKEAHHVPIVEQSEDGGSCNRIFSLARLNQKRVEPKGIEPSTS